MERAEKAGCGKSNVRINKLGNSTTFILRLGGALIILITISNMPNAHANDWENPNNSEHLEERVRGARHPSLVDTQTTWPSQRGNGMVIGPNEKFVTSSIESKRWECRDPETGSIWGWFDEVNETNVSLGHMSFKRGESVECRQSTYFLTEISDCDGTAPPFYLLCDRGKPNMTHVEMGGSADQGCEAATLVFDSRQGSRSAYVEHIANVCSNTCIKHRKMCEREPTY